jgi:hippurate hydrolase
MAAEEFAFMLGARPGNMIFIGNGDSATLHHPAYYFNDAAIPARLVEVGMPISVDLAD